MVVLCLLACLALPAPAQDLAPAQLRPVLQAMRELSPGRAPAVPDGTPVREADILGGRADEELAAVVRRATPFLARSVRAGRWAGPDTTLSSPACGDAAPKLAVLLRRAGIPADLVEAAGHFYVLVRRASGPVVVDPTVRQFFGGARAPASVPEVFVGGYAELRDLFRRHGSRLEPPSRCDAAYLRDARADNSRAREREAAMRTDPGSAENAPLWDFLRGSGGQE